MLTPVATTTRRSPLLLLLAGALTILGYFGMPWWAGLPATETLQLAERLFAVSEQGPGPQLVAFFVAVVVNVVAWMGGLMFLVAMYRFVPQSRLRG
ncbi:MAG TPA: hypothetical protein VE010_08015 [Thermoanaerobaculia bacterium]|nr:hypothetical protein [Thermoanaerobaculia bacterium]